MDYPGEKIIIKLWETLAEKGIGSLLMPWQEKRIAKARVEIRRNEMLQIAQAEKEVEAIKNGASVYQINQEVKQLVTNIESVAEGEKGETKLSLSEFTRTAFINDLSDTIRKESNIAKSIMIAEDILIEDQQEASDKSVDDDWIFSWRDNAGRVSVNELQELWGRILAGEVKQPGTFSLRTLDFLKGLSKIEAELISKTACFVIGNTIYRKKEQFLEKEGIIFADLLFLQDIGVLSGVEATGLSNTYGSAEKEKFFKALVASDRILMLEHEDSSKDVKSEVYLLTKIGMEILKLSSFKVNEEYLHSVAKDYVNKGFKVTIADWVMSIENKGRFYNPIEIKVDENA